MRKFFEWSAIGVLMFALVTVFALSARLSVVAAQMAPPATCEAQLEDARNINIQLRKAKAQSDFNAANLEEQAITLQKQVADLDNKAKAATKAAEKK